MPAKRAYDTTAAATEVQGTAKHVNRFSRIKNRGFQRFPRALTTLEKLPDTAVTDDAKTHDRWWQVSDTLA
jgi:hypothetical protein